jgi:hypothetical protein
MERGIFVERAMNSRLIIIGGILAKDPAQVRLAKYDHVVETFPSDRADQSFHVPYAFCQGEPGAMGARGYGLVAPILGGLHHRYARI